jgi:hypothetical protein
MAQELEQLPPEKTSQVITFSRLFRFFIPLGFSISLVSLSHFIINSTLARATNGAYIISTYAVALSCIGLFERPTITLRQLCSLLVKDRVSYHAMRMIFVIVLSCTFGSALLFSFTSIGEWVFKHLMGVEHERATVVASIFRILAFIIIFSGIRLFYHGIIISQLQTKWLTIAMAIRILSMYGLAQYFILTDQVRSGHIGAIIFLTGIIVECLICTYAGHRISGKLPTKLENHTVSNKSQIFSSYRPLLLSSFLVVIIGPFTNSVLGKTYDFEIAIASFAIAESITIMVNSFFYYTHQIILQFFQINKRIVMQFILMIGLIPTLIMGLISYTPLGAWFFLHVMGVDQTLLSPCLETMKVFMILSFVFPLLDALNGLMLLYRQNKFIAVSQGTNVLLTIVTLLVSISFTQEWNGQLGALAISIGVVGELAVVLLILKLNVTQLNGFHIKKQVQS